MGKRTISVLSVILVCCFLFATGIIPFLKFELTRTSRKELLTKTDHAALLAACLEMMGKRTSYQADHYWHGGGSPGLSMIDPAGPQVPAAIRNLHPAAIHLWDNKVKIELYGGFDHSEYWLAQIRRKSGNGIKSCLTAYGIILNKWPIQPWPVIRHLAY
jgi:hypothetical protein